MKKFPNNKETIFVDGTNFYATIEESDIDGYKFKIIYKGDDYYCNSFRLTGDSLIDETSFKTVSDIVVVVGKR